MFESLTRRIEANKSRWDEKKTTKSFKISNLKDTLCEYRRDSKEERINGKCEIITEKNRKKKKR